MACSILSQPRATKDEDKNHNPAPRGKSEIPLMERHEGCTHAHLAQDLYHLYRSPNPNGCGGKEGHPFAKAKACGPDTLPQDLPFFNRLGEVFGDFICVQTGPSLHF